jgi:hypothetical protein
MFGGGEGARGAIVCEASAPVFVVARESTALAMPPCGQTHGHHLDGYRVEIIERGK